MTAVASPRRVYGGAAYGVVAYGGLAPANIIPTRNTSGILFFASNDRYQVVVCAYGGTLDVAPEFRYWYAAPPSWAEELNNDSFLPPYYATDEDGAVPVGSLELPYRRVKSPQEMTIEAVVVEFIPRPGTISSDGTDDSDTCQFTVQVEAQGVPGYERATSMGSTGIVQSESFTFSEEVSGQPESPWPNIRTVQYPTRISTRCRAARVILTDVQLVEILAVQLLGTTTNPQR